MQKVLKIWLRLRGQLAVLFCLCMLAGLMWSRALLSVSVVLFFANSLHPQTFLCDWKRWRKDYFSIACFLFFLSYVVSGIWSQNTLQWWNVVTNKLPFAVLPFAFMSLPLKQEKWQRVLVLSLITIHLIVVLYSLSALFMNFHYYVDAYNFSHSLPTTKYNDHIRFSLSLVATLIIISYYLFEKKDLFLKKWQQWLLRITAVVFILYLHVLASKTGLLALYLFLLAFAFYLIRRQQVYRKYAVGLLVLLVSLPVCLYFFVPTLREKVNYVRYEWEVSRSGDTLDYNLSDAGRIISYKMAFKAWKKEPLLGTGIGDIMEQMDIAYEKWYPNVPKGNRLIPHSQYLFCLTALGGILCFSLIFLCVASVLGLSYPMFYGQISSVIMMFAFLAEAMLEIQFGVFIYLFFLLFWRNIFFEPIAPKI